MKKKVNKIPKYSGGTPGVYYPDFLNSQVVKDFNALADQVDFRLQLDNPMLNETLWAKDQMNQPLKDPSKNTQNLLTSTIGSAASGAAMGAMVGGPVGGIIGAGVGTLANLAPTIIGSGGSVDEVTGEITNPSGIAGMFGHSEGYLQRKSNIIKNSNLARQKSQALQLDFANQRINPAPNILAAEGGVIPNDEVLVGVTAGEVYKNSNTGEWGIVKGKGMNKKGPKQDDKERMIIPEGSTIINKHEDYIYPEWGNRTGAEIMKPLAKPIKTTGKYAEGTKEAINAIGKKVLHKQTLRKMELHKDEPVNKYGIGTNAVIGGIQLGASLINALKKEKPSKVKYDMPVYYGSPTYVDYSDALRDIDDSYSHMRHAFGNTYRNTGAGMAAGLQMASNAAKQKATIRQNKTNKELELIGKNINLKNAWETNKSNILNQVYDKIDANKAAANNINRTNMSSFINSVGQFGRDLAGWEQNKALIEMLDPLGEYGTQNWKDVLPLLTKLAG